MIGKFKIIKGTTEEVENELNNLLTTNFVKVVSTTTSKEIMIVTIYTKEKQK